jgi:tRNA uridine 5-carboxymethylaminomethyl modification enzyme
VFLEPEGLDTSELYVNGLSTSLPPQVQLEFLQSIQGLEHVRMTRPGYAIEYDYFPPTQLQPSLETKAIEGLFLAGQVNGTTGYEEAAAQGVLAGLNAAGFALGKEMVGLGRGEAFIGVLVDDLVTRGVDEPYRLFTSRAEYRLLLRQDNALRRLLPLAERLDLLTDQERRTAEARLYQEEEVRHQAESTSISVERAKPLLETRRSTPLREPARVSELARRPELPLHEVLEAAGVVASRETAAWADIEFKYAGYLSKERSSVRRVAAMDDVIIPPTLDYQQVRSMSFEAREKLSTLRPRSLGQAGRVPGVSPSDIQGLLAAILRGAGDPAVSRETEDECQPTRFT